MTCCAYSCTQYVLHTHYRLPNNADVLLCLQLHTGGSPFTIQASTLCRCLVMPTAANSNLSFFGLVSISHDSPLNTVNEPDLDTHSFSEIRCNDIKVAILSNYMSSSHFWLWKCVCQDIFGEGVCWMCLSELLRCDCFTEYKTALFWVRIYEKKIEIFDNSDWKHGLSCHPIIWQDHIYKYM